MLQNFVFRSWQHLLDVPITSTSSLTVIEHILVGRVRNWFAVSSIGVFRDF